MIQAIVFDFDDTLVQSERLKREAFVTVFSSIPNSEMIARKFLEEYPGRPRQDTIKGILATLQDAKITSIPDLESATTQFITRYTQEVEDAVTQAEEVSGAERALETLAPRIRLFVNSATPHESLVRIIQRRGWTKHFTGIYGSPPGTKQGHCQEIIDKTELHPNDILVVGDGESDWRVAEALGCHFLGVRGDFNNFPVGSCMMTDGLHNLEKIIETI